MRAKIKELEDAKKAQEDPNAPKPGAAAAVPTTEIPDGPDPIFIIFRICYCSLKMRLLERLRGRLNFGGRKATRVVTVETLMEEDSHKVMRLSKIEAEWKKAVCFEIPSLLLCGVDWIYVF